MKLVTILLLGLMAPALLAQNAANKCDLPQLRNQQRDAATIERLEMAWTEAFLRGDSGFMNCLLTPDFTEIRRTGELMTLPGELALAEKNRGKDLTMPALPKIEVLLKEDVAVAYGNSMTTTPDGKKETRWYSDSYFWKDGQWHAFFAQQTAAEVK
jgi:hypothetical protein